MSSLLIVHSMPRHNFVISQHLKKVSEVSISLIPESVQENGFYLTCNGHIVADDDDVEQGSVYHCIPKLVGGKGGFGSMLRAIGAQIEKTTSREACRDLSGRRMRDVNNEKKLKDWLSKQADREREKEERRQERMARRRAGVQHNFDDPSYSEQRRKVADDLEDALKIGLQAGPSSTVTSSDIRGKRKADSRPPLKAKRQKEWLGLDIDPDDLSSGDSDEDGNSSGNNDKQSQSSEISESENTEDSNQGAPNQTTLKQIQQKSADHVCDSSISSGDTLAVTGEAEPSLDCSSISDSHVSKSQDTVKGETIPVERKGSSLLTSLPPPKSTAKDKTDEKEVKLEDVDLSDFCSASQLEDLGLERLKFALMERGLKCGGTLQQRAERLFSVKGLTRDQIDPSLFPKPSNGKGRK